MKSLPGYILIGLLFIQPVQAVTKHYTYNGDLPFVEMMLNMMAAMGMIDKVPPYLTGYQNYYANPSFESPYSAQYNLNSPLVPQRNVPYSNPSEVISNPRFSCVTGNCGNNKSVQLNGVWVTRYGEMLGIKNNDFLWSDGRTRYLKGLVKVRENDFSLKVNGNGPIMSYQYQIDNMRLQTRDTNGEVRNFIRMPMNQRYSN